MRPEIDVTKQFPQTLQKHVWLNCAHENIIKAIRIAVCTRRKGLRAKTDINQYEQTVCQKFKTKSYCIPNKRNTHMNQMVAHAIPESLWLYPSEEESKIWANRSPKISKETHFSIGLRRNLPDFSAGLTTFTEFACHHSLSSFAKPTAINQANCERRRAFSQSRDCIRVCVCKRIFSIFSSIFPTLAKQKSHSIHIFLVSRRNPQLDKSGVPSQKLVSSGSRDTVSVEPWIHWQTAYGNRLIDSNDVGQWIFYEISNSKCITEPTNYHEMTCLLTIRTWYYPVIESVNNDINIAKTQ